MAIRLSEIETSRHSVVRFPNHGERSIERLIERARRLKNSEPRQALDFCEKARRLSERYKDQRGQADSLSVRSECYSLLGNNDAAVKAATEALDLYTKLDDSRALASGLNHIGNIHKRLGNYVTAIEFYHKSLEIGRTLDEYHSISRTLNNIGGAYIALGNFAKSLGYFHECLRLKDMIDDPGLLAKILSNLGVTYERLGEYSKSVSYYLQALELSREAGNLESEVVCLVNLGGAYDAMGYHSEALSYQLDASKRVKNLRNKELEIDVLNHMGKTYKSLDQYDAALACFKGALTNTRGTGYKLGEGTALLNLGNTFLTSGNTEQALDYLKRALILAGEIKSEEFSYKVHQSLSQVYEQLGNHALGLTHFKAFFKHREPVFGQEAERNLNRVLVEAEIEKGQKEAEIFRLKHVELAKAFECLRQADDQKTELLEKLRQQTEDLERLAREDGLTGLLNRRSIDHRMTEEFKRARRFGHPLSVAIADIDYFKGINDRYSHGVGDQVIKAVAEILKGNSRKVDSVGRYGGEEFVIILTETAIAGALQPCEKVRRVIADYEWGQIASGLNVTISMGLADLSTASSHEELLSNADEKLYEAKNRGRNQVRY